MKMSFFVEFSDPLMDETSGRVRRILFATRTASVFVLDETNWQQIEKGNFDALPKRLLEELIQAEAVVPEGEDELESILARNNEAAEDDDVLYIVIQPTASCQLGCDYCGQKHSSAKLGLEDQNLLIGRALSKIQVKQYRKLFVAWFGAEPLAGLPVIRSLTPRLRALAEMHQCCFAAKVITNGLALTHEIADEIVNEHAVNRIEITLDGTAAIHDARRHHKSGSGTFSRIFDNLVDLARRCDLKVKIDVRCNVDRRNADGVSTLIQTLAKYGLQDRITFYTASVYSWGNNAHELSLPPREYAEREVGWLTEMIMLGFHPSVVPKRKPVVCLATMPRAELVDAFGNLFNCTEVSYVPSYGVPNRYSLGTLKDGIVTERRQLLGDFNSRVAKHEYPCSSCRMLPVCGGACPKKWQEGFAPCPSAKRNIKDRLLLHYAQVRITREASLPMDVETPLVS